MVYEMILRVSSRYLELLSKYMTNKNIIIKGGTMITCDI